ncbi:MAG: hypothetical protein KAX49_20450, partial [Halanaerobiales bacterium]|nr:hypothetical protein [Halanaerobiales bacterium]
KATELSDNELQHMWSYCMYLYSEEDGGNCSAVPFYEDPIWWGSFGVGGGIKAVYSMAEGGFNYLYVKSQILAWKIEEFINNRWMVEASESTRNSHFVEPLGRGSTGRAIPTSLNEQYAMEQVMSNPNAGNILRSIKMTDPRWPSSEGWVKMTQNINGIEIHYLKNIIMGLFDDFKFK